MRKIHVHGTSFTAARALKHENRDSYPAILSEALGIPVVNQATTQPNQDIMTSVIESLVTSQADVVVVEVAGLYPYRIMTKHTRVSMVDVPEDSVYNQYHLLSKYIPLVRRVAETVNKKVYFFTLSLPFHREFSDKLPAVPGIEEDMSGWSEEAEQLVRDSSTSPDASSCTRATVNSIKALMSAINGTDWIDMYRERLPNCWSFDENLVQCHRDVAEIILEHIKQ